MGERTPAGKIHLFNEFTLEPWAFKDPEKFFTDDRPSNNEQYKRSFMYYQDYVGKYGHTRFDSMEFAKTRPPSAILRIMGAPSSEMGMPS
ncbi:MAG: hypothetical protein ACKPKO_21785, partial [Candidatus Fonsibacter sp.]